MGEQLQQLAVPYLITFGIALLVSVLVGPVLIPFLHKLKFDRKSVRRGRAGTKEVRYADDGRVYLYRGRARGDAFHGA